MKQFPLWFWGFLCIFAGVGSKIVSDELMKPPANRSEMLGRATGQLFFVFLGVVLIIVHFVRGNRRR